MAFLRNDAVNRVNLHYGVGALARAGGGVFVLVFLLRAGVPVAVALLAQAAIQVIRLLLRPAILPMAKRWGVKPVLIAGTVALAVQYPVLAEVHGVGWELAALCAAAAVGEVLYWPTYHAYFSAIGDAEHRGHQIGAREALVSVAGIAAPLLGAWALVAAGPRPMFAAVGLVQALAALPLIGAPDVAVEPEAPGGFRAARLGVVLTALDGWFDGWFFHVWRIVLFVTLGESVAAYGGAMALAAVVGAACGLLLGRHVDAGHGRRAAAIASAVAMGVVVLRAASFVSPALAVAANALGPLVDSLVMPAFATVTYNLAKASPCTMRFYIVTEGGWDLGCIGACLVAAALSALGVTLSIAMLLALPALAFTAALLRRYYAKVGEGA